MTKLTPDQRRIINLLCGIERGGKMKYLKEGSPAELAARRALARELKSPRPLDLGLRGLLGDLIDPDLDFVARRIRFEHRHRGRPARADYAIAKFIAMKGTPIKTAVADAQQRYGLRRTRILEIWRKWKPALTKRR